MNVRIPWLLAALVAVMVMGCGASGSTPAGGVAAETRAPAAMSTPSDQPQSGLEPDEPEPGDVAVEPGADAEPHPSPTPTPHPVAMAPTELPKAAIGFEDLFDDVQTGPVPISIEIRDIGVDAAEVIPVGVNEDQTFEVPPANQVGWYKFGPTPGAEGSAVLAAHIAFNGVDGVFRNLETVPIGSMVRVGFDDGSTRQYQVTEVIAYSKEKLPDSLFARTGEPQLALITCGGDFNYQLESYEDNTVVIAVPVSSTPNH